jgi:hypothetical protein
VSEQSAGYGPFTAQEFLELRNRITIELADYLPLGELREPLLQDHITLLVSCVAMMREGRALESALKRHLVS